MHEVSIIQSLLAVAERELANHPGAAVTALRIRVGELRQVIPDTMQFCYEVVTRGTAFEGSRLEIRTVPVSARCRKCGLNFDVEGMIFLCPDCDIADVETTSGNELVLDAIELDDAPGRNAER